MADERSGPGARPGSGRWAAAGVGLVVAGFTAWIASGPSRHNTNLAFLGQDDFFYYLKVAQNLAAGHGSTFNGRVKTNGYHPLWEMTLVAAVWLTGHAGSLRGFLEVAVFAATMATYWLSASILRRGGVGRWSAAVVAAYVAVYAMHIYFYSMEVTLAVPLMLALLVVVQSAEAWLVAGWKGYARAAGVGLLISAVVLSRLDTVIFVALLSVGFAVQPELRRRIGSVQVAGIACGLLPLLGYLALNRVVFGLWEPVSAMAKRLKLEPGFTSQAVGSLLLHKSPLALLNMLPVVAALLALPWLWRRMRPLDRVVGLGALAFPFVYLTALSWLSDWPLWDWYYYAFRPALCAAVLVLAYSQRVRRVAGSRPVLAVAGLCVFVLLARSSWPIGNSSLYDAGLELRRFAATHPGVYAMGDRSGIVSQLLDEPIVQTEGLMMDKAFVETIAQQMPLRLVLAQYGVRYYVGTAMTPFLGCFEAVEPSQAGPHAPHLRGEFCEPPVAEWENYGVKTMVFDLRPEKAATPATPAPR